MNFTFGIITGGGNDNFINEIIESIERESIPNYEVIIVGPTLVNRKNTTVVEFDETVKRAWITRKKNIITENAKYENIVYLHDYIRLNEGWYEGHLKSGNDFYVRMDKIINNDGTRFRDWCIWPDNKNEMDSLIERDCLIPYDITHLSKYMYISGSYWVAKKEIMRRFPLNEKLIWGQGEDVLWSKQVREHCDFSMNQHSSVFIMKGRKDPAFTETPQEKIHILKKWI